MPDHSAITDTASITLLQRRAIEVEVAHAFLSVLTDRVSESEARDIFDEAVARLVADAVEKIHSTRPRPGLDDLWEFWKRLETDDDLDIDLLESSDNRLRFRVNRCSFAEMYASRDRVETGIAFSCDRDAPFAHSLVPGVHMQRSRTILEGAPYCEITYTLEDR